MECAAGTRHVALRVESRGDLAGGVVVQELVDARDDVPTGLAELPRGQRRRQWEAGRGAAAKPDVGRQADGRLDERDVVESRRTMRLRSRSGVWGWCQSCGNP
jgi:hypothetical protein